MAHIKNNKILYIVLLVLLIIILCVTYIWRKSGNSGLNAIINDPVLASKYENANWEEVDCSNSTNVYSNVANVAVSLGHFKEDTIEKYKVVKIICTIYKESTNEVIGKSETYYEDVELKYGYLSFNKTIRVKLSTSFVGNNFSSKIEAYGVKE